LWRNDDGTAVVETAVLMPTLLVIFLGVFEFAWFFFQQQQIETGARDAARYLARVTNGNPCTATDSGGTSYTTYAQNIALYGSPTAGTTTRVPGWTSASITITCPTFDNSALNYNGGTTLYRVLVSVSFADPTLGFMSILGLSAPTVKISHEERSIGPG
jgi:Flp pilus assembly protein TadG